ncbi:MAG TPA: glycogen synthase GlgA [Candidatus Polarisedimenticolia bacterium]|nr:glycogen synthase GlgA [Candidatus Polarisedimenticolia bacterium]
MMATEMAPLAKVGGLADVVGALAPALVRLGHEVRVILPRYAAIDAAKHGLKPAGAVMRAEVGPSGAKVPVDLLVSDEHFGRPGIYNDPKDGKGYPDNAERFIFFQKAALSHLKATGFRPDVIHCHDHQTALVPAYLKMQLSSDPFFAGVASLITIHNLGYQGLFPPEVLQIAGFDASLFYPVSPFEFWGKVNFMKIGLCFADVITTVSPTYAREITGPEQGCGLEGVLASRRDDLFGVLNGIDDQYWSPSKDPHIQDHYDLKSQAGKAKCKTALLSTMELPPPPARKRVPVIGIISRLTEQKGFDLIEKALPSLMQRELRLVVLGSGEPRYVQMLQSARESHPGKVGVRIGFDEALAHLIEAGSDMFLMPSLYEPCGLNQMYSLAYGTVPIVRATGGLADTVREEGDNPNGFVFRPYDAGQMMAAIERALAAYADRVGWTRLMKAGMKGDYSWTASAATYAELYARAAGRAERGVANTARSA